MSDRAKNGGLIHPADTKCKKCPADIWFNKQPGYKKPIPMDCIPIKTEKDGKYFNFDGEFEQMRPGSYAYQSHFATCPKADVFRRARSIGNKQKYMDDLNYDTNDLVGWISFLNSHGTTMKKLEKIWVKDKYFRAKLFSFKQTNPVDWQKVVDHKDKLKETFTNTDKGLFPDEPKKEN